LKIILEQCALLVYFNLFFCIIKKTPKIQNIPVETLFWFESLLRHGKEKMQTPEELEKSEALIKDLSEKILDFVSLQCEQSNCSAAELYIAIRYVLARLSHTLGKAYVDKIEKTFMLVTGKDIVV
jgi:hypothetical protein